MGKVILTSVFTLTATVAIAANVSDMTTAREIGQIVATAELCGYALDADKVAEIVGSKIASMDAVSRSAYQSGGGAHKMRMNTMSEIERKAACAIQANLAKQYGLAP
ncbi:hypothetical protein [Pararhizobium sp.]|uniref:hypothetical protein n=1 Tax=Pararhizobium sp. TaxID=1977563 RepID=UPI002725897A|nr:hypothetical protein [Pararhizobium sp.]MDO9417037.1 hypothetical protein [Pararhizobium sp.]